jgi:hypothetical protein
VHDGGDDDDGATLAVNAAVPFSFLFPSLFVCVLSIDFSFALVLGRFASCCAFALAAARCLMHPFPFLTLFLMRIWRTHPRSPLSLSPPLRAHAAAGVGHLDLLPL